MRPDFWFGVLIVFGGLTVMGYGAWPVKSSEPPEVMTLLIWGLPGGADGTVQWVHGSLSDKEANEWKVWQPPDFVLKHRFIIEGKPLDGA